MNKIFDYGDFSYGVAAVGASVCVQFLHPLDIIKTRMQSHDGQNSKNLVPKYTSIINAMKSIYSQEGVRGFTRGIFMSLLANSIARSLFFIFYEGRKNQLFTKYGNNSQKAILLASVQASLQASILTQPLWVTLTRMQLNVKIVSGYNNMKQAVQQIYSQHGFRGFYRGLPMQLLASCHGMAQINSYEWILHFLNGIEQYQNANSFIAGMASKGVAIYATYPLTTIKTRIQQNQYVGTDAPKYRSSLDIVTKVWAMEGIRGYYKGVTASILKGVPSKGIYFYCYEYIKIVLKVGRNNTSH